MGTASGTVLLILAGCASSPEMITYDRARYTEMKAALAKDLRGIPFGDFEGCLGIEGAKWDDIYCIEPSHTSRLYHFEGFSLSVSLEHKNGRLFTDSHFFPALHADGLDREQRMAEHNAALDRHFSGRARRHKETVRRCQAAMDN